MPTCRSRRPLPLPGGTGADLSGQRRPPPSPQSDSTRLTCSPRQTAGQRRPPPSPQSGSIRLTCSPRQTAGRRPPRRRYRRRAAGSTARWAAAGRRHSAASPTARGARRCSLAAGRGAARRTSAPTRRSGPTADGGGGGAADGAVRCSIGYLRRAGGRAGVDTHHCWRLLSRQSVCCCRHAAHTAAQFARIRYKVAAY